ncbi:MAG: family 16 glycosylhydrolase [Chitinophagaceae bacterium]
MPKLKMRNKTYKITILTIIASLLFCGALFAQPQIAKDNFEGNSTIATWFGDNCMIDTSFNNPYPSGINTSSKVLKYADVGGQYANVRFDAGFNFDLSLNSKFSLKLYVPSSGITGNQNNQISIKLQNGSIASPWQTQSEIIKPVVLNQWQTITFDFATDPYMNLNPTSGNPILRTDFSRVVIQINGENNNSNVLAFIDDFLYESTTSLFAKDDFDGNSTISTWLGDDCIMDNNFINPYSTGINTSSKVLKYSDVGGQYANVRFDAGFKFNLSLGSKFSLKLYVPSSGITGNQNNQISLKLQNGSLASPWQTQSEIIKPVVLNQWQIITFDFASDPYINLNPTSGNPILRTDFSRVVIQINGENNNSNVLAFIDDFLYEPDSSISSSSSPFNNLVWSDEFNSNGAVNTSNWFYQTQLPNGSGWYNGELQHYTNKLSNSFESNGVLNIVAKKETFTDQGQTKQYTSARLNSKFAFKYGRVEVRAKLPTGAGTWPAIWMLGKNINEPGGYWAPTNGTKNWPACGEIDIMEHWGTNQNVVSSAIHFPVNGNLNVGQYVTNAQYKAGVSSDFHIYAVEWTEQKIVFSVDGINHLTYNPSVKNQYTWPFDAEQYILLNVAIEPSVTNSFVQSAMEVDYVRVYQKSCSPTTSTFTTAACGSYTWAAKGNKVYTASNNTDTIHLTNAGGCDSLVTLNLTITQPTTSNTSLIICSNQLPYSWNGLTFTAAGSQTKTGLTNAAGCDSSATLNLSVVSGLPAIVGANAVCAGATTTFTNAETGGVWYTQQTSQATINSSTGVLTAKSAGNVIVQYSKGTCANATKTITVNPIPGVPTIAYAPGTNITALRSGANFCNGKSFTVVGNPTVGSWSFTNPSVGNISNAGLVNFIGVGSGSIVYTVATVNGCTNSRSLLGTVVNCPVSRGINTSVNSLQFTVNSFEMYPNPTQSQFTIYQSQLIGTGTIVITDLYGKQVKQQPLSMGTNNINISSLSKGMYLVSVITNQGKATKKLVVE